jgi:non-ribosomal peptide synthetase component F
MLIDDATVCPVGPPIDPEHTYILDQAGKKVEPGVSGELFVGGGLLARGYLNLPEVTSKAFIPDPFNPGQRMYRTVSKFSDHQFILDSFELLFAAF